MIFEWIVCGVCVIVIFEFVCVCMFVRIYVIVCGVFFSCAWFFLGLVSVVCVSVVFVVYVFIWCVWFICFLCVCGFCLMCVFVCACVVWTV